MLVLPVIDLLGGCVVRAKRGARAAYRPIETPLAPGARAADIVAGFLALHPFADIYIADIDAIEGRAGHEALIGKLTRQFPGLRFWLDAGVADIGAARDRLRTSNLHLVLGSESQTDVSLLAQLRDESRIVLSLDFRNGEFLGPPEIAGTSALWPERVIAMTLARVGAGEGPDLATLAVLKARMTRGALYAAGGVRGRGDLDRLVELGIDGALVASALHDGALSAADLAALA